MIGGLVFVLSAYLLWAMFPLYFKALDCVSALEILSHRIVWSLVFAVIVLFFMRHSSFAIQQEPQEVRLRCTSQQHKASNLSSRLSAEHHRCHQRLLCL